MKIIQVVLAILAIANWLSSKVDQSFWKKEGAREKVKELQDQIAKNIGLVEKSLSKAKAMTPEQLNRELQE